MNLITKDNGRKIARRMYPSIGMCERCKERPATDRHHRDENTANNARSNVLFVCRLCHMILDGRIKNLKHGSETKPARPCIVCLQLRKPLRKGRCHRCNEYHRRHGVEWSPQTPKAHCKNGHAFSDPNTYVEKNGHRHCRSCHAANERRRRMENEKQK